MSKSSVVRFLLPIFIAIALLSSFFVASSLRDAWLSFDLFFFRIANRSIEHHPLQQIFWALANIKITDLYGACFFLSSFLIYVYEGKNREERKIRLGYLIYTLFWFEITILFTKQVLTPICEYIKISRHSPTVVLNNVIALSKFCPWAKVKDHSHFCFPSDHAVIVLQWSLFFTFFAGLLRGLSASIFALIFLLPRLISGAHWISDILVGSVSIVLIAFALGTQTFIYNICMKWIQINLLKNKNWNNATDDKITERENK